MRNPIPALASCLLLVAGAARADDAQTRAALDAAKGWLAHVDGGRFAESWDEAAGLFRSAVTKAQWERSVASVRRPLGKVLSRKVTAKTVTESLPGAPDGKYVVIQYATSFEHKRSAIETVTPVLDADGRWRVSGYYVK